MSTETSKYAGHTPGMDDRPCGACGCMFTPRKPSSRFCSRPCAWSKNGGRNKKIRPENYIQWWTSKKGYVVGVIKKCGRRILIRQHRMLMENHLGRTLLSHEDVHHKNGVRSDNRIKNLEVIDHGKHASITSSGWVRKSGYKLNLTDDQRAARSKVMSKMRRDQIARAALAKLNPQEDSR